MLVPLAVVASKCHFNVKFSPCSKYVYACACARYMSRVSGIYPVGRQPSPNLGFTGQQKVASTICVQIKGRLSNGNVSKEQNQTVY